MPTGYKRSAAYDYGNAIKPRMNRALGMPLEPAQQEKS
jgi:hypothetical protein